MTQRRNRALVLIFVLILLIVSTFILFRTKMAHEPNGDEDREMQWLSQHYESRCGNAKALIPCSAFATCVGKRGLTFLDRTSCVQREDAEDLKTSCVREAGYGQHEKIAMQSCIDELLPTNRTGWVALFARSLKSQPGTEFFGTTDQRDVEIQCIADTIWDLAESAGCNKSETRQIRVDLGDDAVSVNERLVVRVESCMTSTGSDGRESIAMWWRSISTLWQLSRSGVDDDDESREPSAPQMLRDLTGQICPPDLSPKVDPESGWVFFETPDSRFSVLMPEMPKANVYTVPSPDGPVSTAIFRSAPDTSSSFQLSMVAYPPARLQKRGKAALLKDARERALRNGNATLEDHQTEIAIDSFTGQSLTARMSLPDDAFSEMKMQIFFAGDLQIQLLYLAPQIDAQMAARFFESFRSLK